MGKHPEYRAYLQTGVASRLLIVESPYCDLCRVHNQNSDWITTGWPWLCEGCAKELDELW